MSDRARVTVTDVVYVLLALSALAAMWPPFAYVLGEVAPALPEEQQLIFSTMLPVAVLVLLAVVYLEARSGLRSQ